MNKTGKIILYVLGVFILLAALLIVFRGALISYILKEVVWERSDGKVELTLESFHIDLFDGYMSAENPTLLFTDLYMDKSRSIKINKIVYERIEINKLNLWSLISQQDIIAQRFLIVKPEFWLSEHGSASKSDFHPEELIATLNQNQNIFSKIRIKIGEVNIHYGSIKLTKSSAPGVDQGMVDFTILLKQFDTHPDTVTNRNPILYSEEFILKLHNLQRMLPSGYALKIDSALFSSKYRDLIINGVSLQPGKSKAGENNVSFIAGKLVLNDIGLDEIRGLKDLNLHSVVISDGKLIDYLNENSTKKINQEDTAGVNELIKVLYDFKLDSISIRNFDYFTICGENDTMISAGRINFLMTNLKIDSTIINDLFWHLHYDNIIFNTGYFVIREIIPGYSLSYNRLLYSNNDRNLHLEGITFLRDSTGKDQEKDSLSIPDLNINGLSVKDLQKRKKQHLSISVIHPGGNLDISAVMRNEEAGTKKLLFPGYLYLDKIQVSGGNLQLTGKHKISVGVSGLNLFLTGLHLPEEENDKMRLKHITLQYNSLYALLPDKSLRVNTGSLNYREGNLSAHTIIWIQNGAVGKNSLHLKMVNITGFDWVRWITDHELNIDSLLLSGPHLDNDIILHDSNKSGQYKPFKNLVVPFALRVNHVIIKKGKLKGTTYYNGKSFKISTDYNLVCGPLYAGVNDPLKTVLKRINWKLRLENIKAVAFGYRLLVRNLWTDSYNSSFNFKDLSVASLAKEEAEPDSNNINIRALTIPSLTINGLKYDLLIHHDSLSFHSLKLERPYLDLVWPEAHKSQPEAYEVKKFDPKDYLIFGYDTIELHKLNMKIERKKSLGSEFISLNGFDFGHFSRENKSGNLVHDLVFYFKEFSYQDSLTHKFLKINHGILDSDRGILKIEKVSGSNLFLAKDQNTPQKKLGVSFDAHEIEFSGIVMSKTLPTHVNMHKMQVTDMNLNILQSSFEERKKSELKSDFDLMRRFDNILTALQLDTALLSDISFNIHTINDTSESYIRIDSIGAFVENLKADTSMESMAKPDLINKITIDLKGNTKITQDSLYELRSGKLHYNFKEQKITIDSLYITPLFKPKEFFRRAKYQTDRIKFFSPKLEIDDIKLGEFLSNNHLHISSVNLYQVDAELYRDKHYPIRPGTYKPLPREMLMSIQRPLTIDSVFVKDSYFKYREMDAKSDEPGEVFFDRFNARAYNLTNQIKNGEKKNLIIKLNARIMGQSLLHLNLEFPLSPDTIAFRMTGKTEKLDLTSLNPLTTNLLGIGIIKGKGSVDIGYISGTDSVASGALVFRYKKLRMLPYSRKKEKLRKGVLTPLVSFMINDLVVKSNNPKFARKPRVGEVYFKRDTQKSAINYIWKSVLSGLMSTLGFNSKAQKYERKDIKKENR